MSKTVKRVLSVLLCAAMIFGSVAVGGEGVLDLFSAFTARSQAAKITDYSVGDTFEFGWYPQSKVTDSALCATLTAKAGDPSGWISYGYYSGTGSYYDGQMTPKDYMRYIDISYNDAKYRGVHFTAYRPYYTGDTTSHSYQDVNGYVANTVYWFQFEPLHWRVLDPVDGFVMCDMIIDSQPYNNYIQRDGSNSHGHYAYWGDSAKTHYASDYTNSSLRQWLNREFFNTAFSTAQQNVIRSTMLDNRGYYSLTGDTGYNDYDSVTTVDKVFLLSYDEVRNSTYGFITDDSKYDPERKIRSTDYAQSQGCYVSTGSYYKGLSEWWLRSPGKTSITACGVDISGSVYSIGSVYEIEGVRPAFRLNLQSEIVQFGIGDTVAPTETAVTITNKQQFIYVNGTTLSPTVGGNGEVHQAMCYSTTLTKDNVTADDFTWTSGDESILKVTGKRYFAYNDHIALGVDVLGVSAGTTTLTVTTSDGASASCMVNVVKNDYYICVYSSSEYFTTKANEGFNLAFSLYKNGKSVQDWKKMALVVGNSEVIEVSDYKKAKDGQYFVTVNGLKPGVSSLSITDSDSKAHQLLTIKVEDGIVDRLSRRMDKVPTFYPDDSWDHNIPTQAYRINGLYVNNYSLSPLTDGKYTVSFDVYNSKMHNGAVDVFDKNGNWVDSKKIERYQDASSLWDVGEGYIRMISDYNSGQLLAYTASSFSKKTTITVKVPDGGYLTISNNVHDSPGTYMWNCLDLIFFTIEEAISLVSADTVKAEEKTIKTVFSKSAQTKKFLNRMTKNMEKASRKIAENTTQLYLSNNVSEFEDSFVDCFGLTFKDIAKSAVGYGEDIFEDLTGPIGKILKGMFTLTKYIDRVGQGLHMAASYDRPYVTLYTPTNSKATIINGVTVQDDYNAVDDDAVLQVFKIAPTDEIEVSLRKKTTFDSYQTYNICFVKNDTEVQPNGKVTVKIPIPEGMKKNTCSVLREEANGEWTILPARIEENYLVFETNHFSCYAIVGKNPTRLAIKSLPDNLMYSYGDTLNTSGLTVTAFYADGTQEDLTDSLACSPMILGETGEQTVSVSYGNAETTFVVNVAEIKYKVSWVVDDQITEEYYSKGTKIKKPANPVKEGYIFTGWTPKIPEAMPEQDMTFTAVFEPCTYTVKFNGNGATSGSMNNQTFTYDVAQNLTSNSFQREYVVTYNYNGATYGNSNKTGTATAIFNGWATSSNGNIVYGDKQSVKNLVENGICDLYANWSLGSVTLPKPYNIYRITYDANGGDGSTPYHAVHFYCEGWSTSSTATTANYGCGTSYKPNADITLYAVWPTSKSVTLTNTIPTRDGYTFLGWSTSKTATTAQYAAGADISISGDTTIYAVWRSNNVTLQSISIKNKPTQVAYFVGDTLNTSGLMLTAEYSNGSTNNITSGFTCSPTKFNLAGTQTITVTYQGKTATFTVSVSEVPESVSSVSWNWNGSYLYYGYKYFYSSVYTVFPYNAKDKSVTLTCVPASALTIDNESQTFIVNKPSQSEQKVTLILTANAAGNDCAPATKEMVIRCGRIDTFLMPYVGDIVATGGGINLMPDVVSYGIVDYKINWRIIDISDNDSSFYDNDQIIYDSQENIYDKSLIEFDENSGVLKAKTSGVVRIYCSIVDQYNNYDWHEYDVVLLPGIKNEITGIKNQRYELLSSKDLSNLNRIIEDWSFTSSNPSIVSVSDTGQLVLNDRGTSTIGFYCENGNCHSSFTVNVNYTWWQWIIIIVLFGWLWY